MKIDIHLYIHNDDNSETKEILSILKRLQKEGFKVAESAEVTAFRERVDSALGKVGEGLANISADIQRILAGATGLSPEDKAALEDVAGRVETMATQVSDLSNVVPET